MSTVDTELRESKVSVMHLVKLELTTQEMNLLRDALGFYKSRLTDRHCGGKENDPRAVQLRWMLECLRDG